MARQVTFALAVAETAYEFEHRDLHISNILIKTTKKNHLTFKVGQHEYQVASQGIKAIIIDTTFSRLKFGFFFSILFII